MGHGTTQRYREDARVLSCVGQGGCPGGARCSEEEYPTFLVILEGLAGAIGIAIGFVVQQHAAAQEPPDERLSLRLIAKLLRRRVWLAGIAVMIVGQLFGAAALGHGTLALVEPLLASNLLFALPLSARWHHRRLGRREALGAVALIAGLAAFIAAGNPHGGSTAKLPWPSWAISVCTIAAISGALVARSKHRPAATQATMLASAAGILYGLQDALTQRTIHELPKGVVATIISWPALLLVVVAVFGLLLAQSAFEAAPIDASLPAMTAAEPITGIAFGVGVYGEHLNLAAGMLAAEIGGLALTVLGIFAVAGSPIVAGIAEHQAEQRAAPERAA